MDTNSDNSLAIIPGNMSPSQIQDDTPPSGNASTSTVATSPNTGDSADSGTHTPVTDSMPKDAVETDGLEAYIAVIIRDGLDQPIPDLNVKIELPGGPPIETKTDDHGAVTMPVGESKGEATLHVRDMKGQYQEVCKIEPAKCTTGVAVVRSPKVVTKAHLRPHHAKRPASSATPAPSPAPASSPANTQPRSAPQSDHSGWFEKARHWLKDVMHPHDSLPATPSTGAQKQVLAQVANKSGNPITIVAGPECPNKDNLRLGRNSVYRQIIIDASKRFDMCPQALAALIDAEAGKIDDLVPLTNPDGTPKLIKSGKQKGKPATRKVGDHWNPNSLNPTGAAGLTQFIESTWLGLAIKGGCYINEQCLSNGWVKEVKDAKGRKMHVFVLADGSTTDKPLSHKGDAHVRACLNQRFVAEWSIMAAADYGMSNLKRLKELGFKLTGLSDVEKAKLMYLMHHEGEPAGPLVIRNKLNQLPKGKFATVEARIRYTLIKQVGESKASDYTEDAHGNVAKAYRTWLAEYIDDKITFTKFCCDSRKFPDALKTIEILGKIGGEK
jgi:hypothetical protein